MRTYFAAPPTHAFSVIQRECACGGACAECAGDDRFGVQTKLRLGSTGDRFEQEADRIADQITQSDGAPLAAPIPVSPMVQRMEDTTDESTEEEEEAIQSKSGPGRPARQPAALQSAAHAVASGGHALSQATRAYFEPRFGRDLSHVRLHTNAEAGDAAQRIGARAYALRNHIAFAPGAYNPGTHAGRHLMAHELTHVVQQGAAPDAVVRRAPEEDAAPKLAREDIIVHSSPGAVPEDYATALVDENWMAVSPIGFIFGDAMDLWVESTGAEITNEVTFTFDPAQIALSERYSNTGIRAHIVAPPQNAEVRMHIGIKSKSFEQDVTLEIAVDPAPARANTTDDKEEQLDRNIADKRAERATLKSDFRAQSRSERRAGRAEFRDQKRQLRQDIRSLRKERRAQRDTTSCSLSEQQEIEKAANLAADMAARALSRIDPGAEPDGRISWSLSKFFGIDTSTSDPAEIANTLQRVADVLNLARNSILISRADQYKCGDYGCSDTTGALVRKLSRGNTVSLCQKWLRGNISFPLAATTDDARAYAILHEFVHLSGIDSSQEIEGDDDGELYYDGDGWNKLTPSQYKEMADAHSSFAWAVAGNKGGDGS